MKKSIFEALMQIKAEVLQSLQPRSRSVIPDSSTDTLEKAPKHSGDEPSFVPIDDNPAIQASTLKKYSTLIPETRYFSIEDGARSRKIAYTISGDENGQNILLCLPGLLETRASFLFIHSYFLKFENCKVISIDFSGRGESDYLDERGVYKMSLYLSDVSQLIREVILLRKHSHQKLTILGTSMGGVLAMYLTNIFGGKIYGIILNDIALTVNWTSLYGLYKAMKNEVGFKEVRELAKELSVDERAISDVQLPGHFDLSYRADVWGMNFHEALDSYKGRVGLICGGNSKICTKQRVGDAKSFIPHLNVLEVEGAGHPVPFSFLVCDFIQQEMGV